MGIVETELFPLWAANSKVASEDIIVTFPILRRTRLPFPRLFLGKKGFFRQRGI
jgi:hypothetical protein